MSCYKTTDSGKQKVEPHSLPLGKASLFGLRSKSTSMKPVFFDNLAEFF